MAKGTKYSQEFKEDAVRYRLEHPEMALRKCAENLGISESALKNWMKSAKNHEGAVPTRGSGNYASDEAKEIARLQRELRDSLICDFCPSDQGFAYSFLQIPPHDGHPCCSTIHFPLPGHVQDFHLRERAHGAQTKRAPLGALPLKRALTSRQGSFSFIYLLFAP